jgi:hypothetical protein
MEAAGAVPAGAGLPVPEVEHPADAMKKTPNSAQNHRWIMRSVSSEEFSILI